METDRDDNCSNGNGSCVGVGSIAAVADSADTADADAEDAAVAVNAECT